jgi:hypothetical protein
MEKWKVSLYIDAKGGCPFSDEWLSSGGVSAGDRAKIDDLPPNWWSKYHASDGLNELRVTGPGKKMLRPLGVRVATRELMFFYGSVEKGNQLNSSDLTRANKLKHEWETRKGSKKGWRE